MIVAIIAIVMWLVNSFLDLSPNGKRIFNTVIICILLIWLLYLVITNLHTLKNVI